MLATNRFLGSTLLIAGTAIGAGMLALPVLTGESGFFSASLLMALVWLFNLYVAFIILEATLRLPTQSNLISIIGLSLGKGGQTITWISCIIFLYALLVTYLSGLSELLLHTLDGVWGVQLPAWSSPLILTVLFSAMLYLGTSAVDYTNRLFAIGFLITFIGLVISILPQADLKVLAESQGTNPIHQLPWYAATVVFGSFAYMIVIPSVRDYLQSDVKKIKCAIFVGSIAPLILYLVWVGLILAVVPADGEASLRDLSTHGDAGTALTDALHTITNNELLVWCIRGFAFFAMATSFIGVALGLHDLLSDGLNLNQTRYKNSIATLLTILPPFVFTFNFRQLFLNALILASEFAVLLHVILPTLAVWIARRQNLTTSPYVVRGGYAGLGIVLLAGVVLVVMDVRHWF
jgi:tyrosine-specific transport protein